MDISKIAGIQGIESPSLSKFSESKGPESDSFSSFLDKSINDVNDMLVDADKKGTELAVGKSENLHEAMISMEKAETALKLLVQVRNKAMDAYNQIIQMQV